MPMADLIHWLEDNGFLRTATVREPGEYAVRGGILDLYAPAAAAPLRLDFFGDTLETIRAFDAETQRTTDRHDAHRPGAGQRDRADGGEHRPLPPGLRRRIRRRRAGRPALSGGQRRPALRRHGALAAAVRRRPGDAVRSSPRRAGRPRPPRRRGHRRTPRPDRRPLSRRGARPWRRATSAAARPTSRCRPTGSTSTATAGPGS